MKTFEKNITINFSIHRIDGKKVNSCHIPNLETQAIERINDQWRAGYTSGELIESVKDVEYSGWWEIKVN